MEVNNIDIVRTMFNFGTDTYHILHISQRAKDYKWGEWPYEDDRNVRLEAKAFHSLGELEADMDKIKSICRERNARAYISCEEFKILKEDWKEHLGIPGGPFQCRGLELVPPLFQLYDWDKGQDMIDERVSEWMIEREYCKYIVPTVTGRSIICCDFDDYPSFIPRQIFTSRLKRNPHILLYYGH